MAKYRISEIIKKMESSIDKLKESQKNAGKNLSQIKEMKEELASLRDSCVSNVSHLFFETVNQDNYKAYGLFFEHISNKKDYITMPLNDYNQKLDEHYKTIRFHTRNIIEQMELQEQTLNAKEETANHMNRITIQQKQVQNQLQQLNNQVKTTNNQLPEENSLFNEIKSLAKTLNMELTNESIEKLKEENWQFKFKKTFSFGSGKLKNEIKLHDHLISYEKLTNNKYLSHANEIEKLEKQIQSLTNEQIKIEKLNSQLEEEHTKTLKLVNHSDKILSEISYAIKNSKSKKEIAENEEKLMSSDKENILYSQFLSNFSQQIKKNPNVLFDLDEKIRTNNYENEINYQIIYPNLKKASLNPKYIENLNQFKDTMVLEQELSKGIRLNNDIIKKLDDYIKNIEKNLKKLKKAPSKSNSISFKLSEFEQSIDSASLNVNNILNKNKNHIDLNQQFKNDYFYRKELNQELNNDIFLNNYIYYMLINSMDKESTSSFMGISQQSMESINLDALSNNSFNQTNVFNSSDFNNQLSNLCQTNTLTELMGIENSFACFDQISSALSNIQSDSSFNFNADTFTLPDISSGLDLNISSNTFDSFSTSFDLGSSSSSSWDSSSSSSSYDFSSSSSSWDSSSYSSFDSGSGSSW